MLNIILPTYNPSNYLNEQIDSILSQRKRYKWKLVIRDDCSKDSTLKIINKYCQEYPDKVFLLDNNNENIGTILNISCLLQYSKTNYNCFCDQDDVWLPHKLEITINKMQEMEKKYGKRTPILIHTDLQVVDQNLNLINSSFWKHQNLNPNPPQLLSRLLVQNFVTGCTMMINKPLKDLITPIPSEAIMHDWWIALAAATLGKIAYIPEPTVLYRQHQQNSIGARKWGINYILSRLNNLEKIRNDIQKTIIQAQKFRETFAPQLSPEQLDIIDTYIHLPQKSLLTRKYLMIKKGYYQIGKLKNLGFLYCI
jgi:glycosyltransferase involved in cell wall biosynthesis